MQNMKQKYRIYRRDNGIFYLENTETGEQKTLKTKDRKTAKELQAAENKSQQENRLNFELGKIYLRAADEEMANRTWKDVLAEICLNGQEQTKERYERAFKSGAFDCIRDKPCVETRREDFNFVIKKGGISASHFLRRLHNLALANEWLFRSIIPARKWPCQKGEAKQPITLEEHLKILEAERNVDRKNYYQMLWEIGAAQTDCAMLSNENIDRAGNALSYQRRKTGEWASIQITDSLAELLNRLPKSGFLFPYMASLKDSDRAAEFARRCKMAGVPKGKTLHSYRYSWAQRAYEQGYPERLAMAALGHSSRAVHHYYSKGARPICPPLKNIIPFKPEAKANPQSEQSEKVG